MPFIYHDLYSIYLLFIIFLICICFINDRKQIKSLLLIPFKTKESYGFFYFQRNINFSFMRFLYFMLIILISSAFLALLYQNYNINDFFNLMLIIFFFFIIKYATILLIGFILNKYLKFKKIAIINIDIKTFVSIYFLPVLVFVSYTELRNIVSIYMLSIIFIILLLITKIIFLIKSTNFIGLKFIDIISYICILEIIPIIALYTILK